MHRLYRKQYGSKFVCVIPVNVYGPHDNYHLVNAHVIPALIHKCHKAMQSGTHGLAVGGSTWRQRVASDALACACVCARAFVPAGEDLVVFGSGKPLRQFVYSKDLARLFLRVLDSYEEDDPIILTVPESMEISIAKAAELVANAMNFQGKIVYDTGASPCAYGHARVVCVTLIARSRAAKADGQFKKTASDAKRRQYFPDFEFTPIEAALKESAEWFVKNFDTARK